jgi:hypothetical protein
MKCFKCHDGELIKLVAYYGPAKGVENALGPIAPEVKHPTQPLPYAILGIDGIPRPIEVYACNKCGILQVDPEKLRN